MKRVVLQDESCAENYSTFLYFTRNYEQTSEIFVPLDVYFLAGTHISYSNRNVNYALMWIFGLIKFCKGPTKFPNGPFKGLIIILDQN